MRLLLINIYGKKNRSHNKNSNVKYKSLIRFILFQMYLKKRLKINI